MFHEGIQEGQIGLEEKSWQMHFIFARITKKPYNHCDLQQGIITWQNRSKLRDLFDLDSICGKYMFESVRELLHRLIAQAAVECPPQALAFALRCDPPDALVAKAELVQFKDLMVVDEMRDIMKRYFVSGHFEGSKICYSPAPENLCWSFVNNDLGFKAYYAYTRALGEHSRGKASWDWPSVATEFLDLMGISVPTLPGNLKGKTYK